MPTLTDLTARINAFNDSRDWRKFLDHKSVAASVTIEAAELLEHFQWKDKDEARAYAETHREEIGDEMADVLIYLLELADVMGIDLGDAVVRKIEKNGVKYPIEKKGRSDIP